jgi:hypothetical protein
MKSLIFVAAMLPTSLMAECLPRAQMLEMLDAQFDEARIFVALSHGASVIEVYANLADGTWTALETLPDGTACIVAFGDNFVLDRQGVDG